MLLLTQLTRRAFCRNLPWSKRRRFLQGYLLARPGHVRNALPRRGRGPLPRAQGLPHPSAQHAPGPTRPVSHPGGRARVLRHCLRPPTARVLLRPQRGQLFIHSRHAQHSIAILSQHAHPNFGAQTQKLFCCKGPLHASPLKRVRLAGGSSFFHKVGKLNLASINYLRLHPSFPSWWAVLENVYHYIKLFRSWQKGNNVWFWIFKSFPIVCEICKAFSNGIKNAAIKSPTARRS